MEKNYSTRTKKFVFSFFALFLITNYLTGQTTVQTFSYSGTIQTFTVPTCVYSMTIQAKGAEGGYNATSTFSAGLGASMTGVFAVTPGQVLKILVGQQPSSATLVTQGNGGGGGSFVTYNNNTPLIVAGGGGGSSQGADAPSKHGQITTSGGTGASGGGLGGTAGSGGSIGATFASGAGGGLLTDGATGWTTNTGGIAFVNGGNNTITSAIGGFGGGGSGSAYVVGGGGGGYSGGGSGSNSTAAGGTGGGGGSFNGGTSQVNVAGVNTGHGAVSFTFVPGSPITAAATPTAVCVGATTTLNASGVLTYTWLPSGVHTSSITDAPTTTTNYTVLGTNSTGCTTTMVVTVPVFTIVPTLTITNTANAGGICPTKTVVLTASGATSYTWTGGATTVTNGVAFAPPTATNYTVTGENSCGTNTAVTSVSVHPLPTVIAVASTASLCSGTTLTLNTTGSNASTYTWTGGYTSGTGFSPVVTATYVVTGTSALSCTASAAVPVTVVTTPVNAPTSSTLINCIGNSVTLTATGATNYTWTSATQTVFTPTLLATPSATGIATYTVTKSNSNCVDTKMISITTNSLPTIFAIASPTLVCALRPTTLAVGGGQSYTWTAPGTPTTSFNGAAPVVYPLAPSVYTVAASDGTCVSRTTVAVAVDPNPTLTVSSPTAICDGQSVTLNAGGAINYTWTSTSGGTFNNTLTITDTPTTTVAYNITGDNSFGCTSSIMQVVIVNPNPTITVSATKTLVCSGLPATLTANGAANYTWTSNNALTNTTVVNPMSLTSAPVIYTAVGAYTTGCVGSKTFAVNVFVPVLTVSGNTNTCAGGMLTLAGAGGNNGTYMWNTGTSTTNFQTLTTTLTAASVFTLNATTTSITTNCPATKTVAVGIYFNPTITAVAQRTTICNKESVDLHGDGGVSYSWSNGMQGGTITVAPLAQTNYTVTGTDANGCVSTGTVQVKVSGCVGIDELTASNSGLLVYPNPNNGEFTVQSGSELTLTLINELGQVTGIYGLSEANNYKASVTGLAKGIYFISGQSNSARINQKIIVTR